jgi:hypothetical protein
MVLEAAMRLEGRIFRQNIMIREAIVEQPETGARFIKLLDDALIHLCRQIESPLPIWLEKNTHEFARFHQTIFFDGQFTERIDFDRFQIRLL